MKTATGFVLAMLALSAVANGSRMLNEQPDATTVDPALKEFFGEETYAYLLTLPQDEANALAGQVVNGTQMVCTCVLHVVMLYHYSPYHQCCTGGGWRVQRFFWKMRG